MTIIAKSVYGIGDDRSFVEVVIFVGARVAHTYLDRR